MGDELPPGWRAVDDVESGSTYYWNQATDQTVWVVLASGCGPAGGDALGGGASYLLRSPCFCALRSPVFGGKRSADGRISGPEATQLGLAATGGVR